MKTLANISLKTREVWLDFNEEGLPGFRVLLAYCGREVAETIRKKATKITFKNGTSVPELDQQLFSKLFVEHAVRGWEGLTYRHLDKLMLVDLSEIEDWDEELSYTPEGAFLLASQSTVFDNWLTGAAFELDNFRNKEREESPKEV